MSRRRAPAELLSCPWCAMAATPHLPGCPYADLSIEDAVREHRRLGEPPLDEVARRRAEG